MDSEKRDALIQRFVNGAASVAEVAELQALLQTEPALMRQLFAAAELERDLQHIYKPEQAKSDTRVFQALKNRPARSSASARFESSRRTQVPRRRMQRLNPSWAIPGALAACGVLALLLFLSGSPRRDRVNTAATSPVTPTTTGPNLQQTREELANVEAEQRRIQQQLVRIERERRELAHTPQAPTTAEAQERTANLERIEAERRRVAAELEAMRATRSQLQQQLEVAQGQAPVSPRPELPVEPQTIPAPAPVADVELAQVEYVAEGNVKPVLVRTKGGELTRTPLTARMRLVAGDKIDIPKAGGTQTAPREARVTVKLWCGPIDLADDTQIEFIDFERVTLARGQLFADLNLAQRNSRAETSGLYQVIVDTPLADVIVEGTRFELATDVLQTRLRMEEGKTSFVSSRGRQQVYALQESVARANAAPTKPTAIDWVSIWRGRRKAPEPQVVSFALINTETRQPIEGFDPLLDGAELKLSKLPTRQFSVRANTVPEQIGSVQFGLNDTPVYRVESFAPYALSGDKEENYSAWNPEAGSYRLTATPYEQANARGKAGKGLTITIRVAP